MKTENFKTGTQLSVTDFIFSFIFFCFTALHCKGTGDTPLSQHVHNAQFESESVQSTVPQQQTVVMTTQKLNFQVVTQ